jgi:hypothetical protein
MTLRPRKADFISAGPNWICDRSDLSEETGKRAFSRLYPIRMRDDPVKLIQRRSMRLECNERREKEIWR